MNQCKKCENPATQLFRCKEHFVCDDCGSSEHLFSGVDSVLCPVCREARVKNRINSFSGDTAQMNDVVCPHCGHVHADSFEMHEGPMDCHYCERSFEMTREVTVTYSTTKK